MPSVSIVIPTYHRAALLADALASIAAQTFADYEVLVCDNGNEPEIADLVAGMNDDRFRYFPRETNVGMLSNALAGFGDARGTFVMKLDDDDRLHPAALARLIEPLTHHADVTMVFGRLRLVGSDGTPDVNLQRTYDSLAGRDELTEGRYQPFGSMAAHSTTNLAGAIVRRTCLDLEHFPPDVATAYDLFICLCAAADGAACHYVDDVIVDYMIHPASDTNTHAVRQLSGQIAALDRASASGRSNDVNDFDAITAVVCVRLGRELLRAGRTREARGALARAYRISRSIESTRLCAISLFPARLGQLALKARTLRLYERVAHESIPT